MPYYMYTKSFMKWTTGDAQPFIAVSPYVQDQPNFHSDASKLKQPVTVLNLAIYSSVGSYKVVAAFSTPIKQFNSKTDLELWNK